MESRGRGLHRKIVVWNRELHFAFWLESKMPANISLRLVALDEVEDALGRLAIQCVWCIVPTPFMMV